MHSKAKGLLIVATASVFCLASTDSVSAQQRREEQSPTSQVTTPVAGTQVFIGVEGGYDTNLDNRVAKQGSRYEMLQGGFSTNYKASASESYSLYARGRNYTYNELDVSHRYDIDTAVGARYDFSKETSLKVGGAWLRDAVKLSKYDAYTAFADLVNESDLHRLRIKLDSRTEIGFRNNDQQGLLDPDVFEVSRTKAFDYTKNGSTASLLLFRKQFIAPFLIGNYTNIEYIHQAPNPAIDRRANEYWGVAGLRFSFGDPFYIDVGARHNHRDMEDRIFREFASTWYDARFTWKVTPTWTITGIVERQNKEPTTSFGVVDDVITYELSTRYKMGAWTFFGRAFLDRVRPVGDDFNFYKYNWSAGFINELSKTVDLYADYSGRYVTEKINDEAYTRHRVGAGVKIKF